MDKQEQAAEQLFGEALDLPRGQRQAFLDHACAGKPALRRMVEDLLDENDQLSGFLSEPVFAHGREAGVASQTGVTAAGRRLLERYVITGKLGAGGMGVVYRALDEKLNREIAVKMLQPGVLAGEEARTRFRREAQALAKMSHAHIASIHDVIEQDGVDYIVMELVPGESLATKLRGGALAVREATTIALQVAEALEEAHEQGVIHRDLKPANLMITPKGQVKVLDFGVARLLGSADVTQTATETVGVIGTPLYMSPEQVIGQKADVRSDLWSLGVMYYQSLTGVDPFSRPTIMATLRAITDETVQPVRELHPQAPVLAEQIVARALEKDPDLRYQHAREFATDLRRVLRDLGQGPAGVSAATSTNLRTRPRAFKRQAIAVAAIAVAALAGLLAIAYFLRPTVPPLQVTGITQLTHDGLQKLYRGSYPQSPMVTDGLRVYYEVTGVSGKAIKVVSTAGGESETVPLPFSLTFLVGIWPPRSELLILGPPVTVTKTSGLWTLPVPRGQPRRVGELSAFDATWAPDGETIYFTKGSEIWTAKSDGSQAHRILALPPENQLYGVRFSHDARRIRFSAMDEERNTNTLWEAGADGGRPQPVLANWNACCGSWTPDGKYFVFASTHGGDWNLWAMREEHNWWRKSNPDPVRLTMSQMGSQVPLPSTDGKRIFFVGTSSRSELVRFDSKRRETVPYLPGLSAEELAFSQDGSKLAYIAVPEGSLWRSKSDGSDPYELTFGPMRASAPRWSPDGSQIVFEGQEPGEPSKIYIVAAEGGSPLQVSFGELDDADPTWSPDGQAVAFGGSVAIAIKSNRHPIQILNLKTRQVTPLPDSGRYFSPRWSPDDRSLLAVDALSGKLDVYDFSARTWQQLSDMPAGWPNWLPHSDCVVFYATDDATIPLYRTCLKDRKARLLGNLIGVQQTDSVHLRGWIGLAPDGSILATRDISTEEIYALDVQLP